jgi:hypothetical protein
MNHMHYEKLKHLNLGRLHLCFVTKSAQDQKTTTEMEQENINQGATLFWDGKSALVPCCFVTLS